MTGNLSRTVLRGAGARESACLPDVTNFVYAIHFSYQHLLARKRMNNITFSSCDNINLSKLINELGRDHNDSSFSKRIRLLCNISVN
ncbi:hypothetical protein C1N90_09210 [Priestia aryabhattai]